MDSSARSLSTDQGLGQAASPWDALRAAVGQFTRTTRLDTTQVGALPCLMVVGSLDKRIAPELKAQAKVQSEQDTAGWAVDLSGVTAWDSAGLAALVYALDVSELAGKQLTVLNPTPALRQTLERAQLHRLFTIVSSD